MSYRSSHLKNKIKKIRPKKSIFKRPIFWYSLLLFCLVSGAVYFLVFFPNFQIKNIVISGNEKVNSKDIESIVQAGVDKKIISFFNWQLLSRSIFLVDMEKLNKDIIKKFPVIEKIKVSKKFPQTLIIGVTERKPVGVFCDNNQQCFLIDENGIIFEKTDFFINEYNIIRQTLSSREVFVGEEAIGKNIMDMISKIKSDLKDNFQIDMTEALVSSATRMDVKTSENWQIYFNPGAGDINLQLIKLNLLLEEKILPADRSDLQYIDLRFDRAYYK